MTINRRCHFGFGWTSQPIQTLHGLEIRNVVLPQTKYHGLKALQEAFYHAARSNQGHDWNAAIFVRGERVAHGVRSCSDFIIELEAMS